MKSNEEKFEITEQPDKKFTATQTTIQRDRPPQFILHVYNEIKKKAEQIKNDIAGLPRQKEIMETDLGMLNTRIKEIEKVLQHARLYARQEEEKLKRMKKDKEGA